MNKSDLGKLNDEDLNLYIGKVTRKYLESKLTFEKDQNEYNDLNLFLSEKTVKIVEFLRNEKETNECLEGDKKLFNSSKDSAANFSTIKLDDEFKLNVIEDKVLNDIELNPVLVLDKLTRDAATSKLCNKGEVGFIKRDISIRPQIKSIEPQIKS